MRSLYSLGFDAGVEFARKNSDQLEEVVHELKINTGHEVSDGFVDGILSVFNII